MPANVACQQEEEDEEQELNIVKNWPIDMLTFMLCDSKVNLSVLKLLAAPPSPQHHKWVTPSMHLRQMKDITSLQVGDDLSFYLNILAWSCCMLFCGMPDTCQMLA